MTDLSKIPDEELIFDRQECHNDLTILAHAMLETSAHFLSEKHKERVQSNLRMIRTIDEECKKRGFDSAQYRKEGG